MPPSEAPVRTDRPVRPWGRRARTRKRRSRQPGRPEPGLRQPGPPGRGLGLARALALGALQGPTELLPVSSSAHTTLIPWLAGWPYSELAPELRKSFEIALHAGGAAALALELRGDVGEALGQPSRRGVAASALSLAPPALAGYLFERPIARRLGGPRSIAVGLLAGALAMALADARPGLLAGRDRGGDGRRELLAAQAGALDGLALGLAQAVALAPGVSRNGATLAAARARGFARADAQTLSWRVGLPVIAGASALKTWRVAASRGPLTPGAGPILAAGAASAFVSTRASAGLRRRVGEHSLLPYCLYRCALAAVALRRLRRTQNGSG